ncbi:hypothetical protein JQ562_30470 [Bradyrhizobium sp. AUGA SZCCT0051]|nr:hypothetical protein [Bradyrhizobium sp. AUGA SZCCT0124]MBR1315391.1 hypothetical protein [Bradyrhizobium sp. AUGA SZCCT0051]MBR1338547.1 hypothetical protein [Bradyrhizobium sp. AUGA SZCCT0105]MBR1356202.1 hypothetical protein [Bradyrhizobium sp. AUGA SZCCT0045]
MLFAFASSLFLYFLSLFSPPGDRYLIRGAFQPYQGSAYRVPVVYPVAELSSARLYEDDKPLGPANSKQEEIATIGHGLFALTHGVPGSPVVLTFSSSDNSDPSTNGRKYRLK